MEDEEECETEGSVFQPAMMLDDRVLGKRKKIRPPRMLELTEKGRENEPLGGMAERDVDDL